MTMTLQVLYPTTEGTTFDYDYYTNTHLTLVDKHMGPHIANSLITKGVAGGAGSPAPYYIAATIVFADQSALDAAMAEAGPVIEDIAKFTDTAPIMLVGEVMG